MVAAMAPNMVLAQTQNAHIEAEKLLVHVPAVLLGGCHHGDEEPHGAVDERNAARVQLLLNGPPHLVNDATHDVVYEPQVARGAAVQDSGKAVHVRNAQFNIVVAPRYPPK